MHFPLIAASAVAGLAATGAASTHQHAHAHEELQDRAYYQPGTYIGCYSSLGTGFGLPRGAYSSQSSGYCNSVCQSTSLVYATFSGDNCVCGPSLPPNDQKVSDTLCNAPCAGYTSNTCGSSSGTLYYSVYESVGAVNVPTQADSTSDSSSSSSTSAPQSSTTTGGVSTTVIRTTVTPTSKVSGTSTPDSGHSSSGSTIGIAVGVVVGILVLVALIGGGLFYVRRRRAALNAENSHRRADSLNAFVASGATLPGSNIPSNATATLPSLANRMTLSDSRLDPRIMVEQRRQSAGSVFADNQDYSRRILRVANPDG